MLGIEQTQLRRALGNHADKVYIEISQQFQLRRHVVSRRSFGWTNGGTCLDMLFSVGHKGSRMCCPEMGVFSRRHLDFASRPIV